MSTISFAQLFSIFSRLSSHSQCRLCRQSIDSPHRLWCRACLEQLQPQRYCQQCGHPQDYTSHGCLHCQGKAHHWHHFYQIGAYQFPLDTLIHQFKFQRRFELAQPLTQLLASEIIEPAPLLLPVPLHRTRYWSRGFNQSQHLAWALAKELNCQCDGKAFQRIRATPAQKQLSRRQRHNNLHEAFVLTRDLPEHIALVDDVVTTGSTLNALIKLLPSDVKRIDIYALSYAPFHHKK